MKIIPLVTALLLASLPVLHAAGADQESQAPAAPPLVAKTSARAAKTSTASGKACVYKKVGDRELKLYIVNPADWKATDQRPAMVFFHGGSRVSGGPTQFNEQADVANLPPPVERKAKKHATSQQRANQHNP